VRARTLSPHLTWEPFRPEQRYVRTLRPTKSRLHIQTAHPTFQIPQGLRETDGPQTRADVKGDDETEEMTERLENMYEKYSGNLDDIFEELGEDPGKAKKYPPENAKVFARKYREGFYSYIKDEARAEAK